MKVALLHYSCPPVIGGVERVLEQHARLLSAAGHEVTVICGVGQAPDRSPGTPIRLIIVPELAASHPRVKVAQAELTEGKADAEHACLRAELVRVIGSHLDECSVVMLHNVCMMPFHLSLTEALWQLAVELPQTRFVCWIHDLAAVNPDYHIPQSFPWNLLSRANDGFEYVAVSDLRQRQMSELTGLAPERVTVIPNGLDPTEELGLSPNVGHLAKSVSLLDADIILLQPTRLLRRKNVELSLRLTAALRSRGLRTCLLVTGAPDPHNGSSQSYANHLLSLRNELQLRNDCYFLGELFEVTDEDIRSLYLIADALFFPSYQEGFGLPMLEAALHRVPAFCADIEPLRHLPGAIPFPLNSSPTEIAALIIRQMEAWPANSPRKAVVRNYAWPAVYRKYLAPLLKRYKESRHP